MLSDHNGFKTRFKAVLICLSIILPLSISSVLMASQEQDRDHDLMTTGLRNHSIDSIDSPNNSPLILPSQANSVQAVTPNHDSSMNFADRHDLTSTSSTSSIMFIENMGQFDDQARFQVQGKDHTLWLTEDALWVSVLEEFDPFEAYHLRRAPDTISQVASEIKQQGVNIKFSFVGANPHPRIEPFNRLDTYFNYFQGNDSSKWRSEVRAWGGVRYVDLYPGVDLEITSRNGELVQRMVANGQASPNLNAIRLRAEGADKLTINNNLLHITTSVGDVAWPLLERATADDFPTTRRTDKVARAKVESNEILAPFASRSSQASSSDARLRNNSALKYSVLIGSSGDDLGTEAQLDSSGNIVVTGRTNSQNFPVAPGSHELGGNYDLFVLKLSSNGEELLHSTLIGGSVYDEGSDLAIDQNDNIIVVGSTNSTDFPAPNASVSDNSHNGRYDAVVLKLHSDGTSLVYSAFLGGSLDDYGYSLALDRNDGDKIVVTGKTASSNFPSTNGVSHSGKDDVFVSKLTNNGQSLRYSTLVGGSGDDGRFMALEVDDLGAAIVTGLTDSSDFPIRGNPYDNSFNGGSDLFVFKLSQAGDDLLYSTFIGGNSYEESNDLKIDANGDIFIAGTTSSPNFPTDGSGTKFKGDRDAFVLKLAANGSGLIYSRLMGGNDEDNGVSLALNGNGELFISGSTLSDDFPITNAAYDPEYNGAYDIFISQLASDGASLLYSTFVGGTHNDNTFGGLAVDGDGNLIVIGETASTDFPTKGLYGLTHNGGKDVFVLSLKVNNTPPMTTLPGAYIRSEAGIPYSATSNEERMNDVFGVNNWQDVRYETLDPSAIFSSNMNFVFMEGSDQSASQMGAFMENNQATIENWVSGGGCLLVNASPTGSDGVALGFGVSSNPGQSASGTAVDANHPVFSRPDEAGISFAGDKLGEGVVSGDNLTPLIQNENQQAILGQKRVGEGRILFGGLSLARFGSLEQPQHNNLHRNIIYYTAHCTTNSPPRADNVTINPATLTVDEKAVVETAGTSINVTYDYFDGNNDAERNPIIRWKRQYKLENQEEPGFNNKRSVTNDVTIREEYWCVTVTPYDGIDYGIPQESCAYIERVANQLPSAVPYFVNESPTVDQPVEVAYQYDDPDGGSEQTDKAQVRWYRNGQLESTLNDFKTVSPSRTSVGEEWCVMVRVHDDVEYGGVSQDICTIINPSDNPLPFITNARVSPAGEAKNNEDLKLDYIYNSGVLGRGAENVEIRWLRNRQLQPSLNNSDSVSSILTSPGDKWQAAIRPLLSDTTIQYSLLILTEEVLISDVANTPPQATNLVVHPQIPSSDDNLRFTYDFTDADNDPQGDTIIEWYRNRVYVEQYDGIRVIPADQTNPGEVWHVVVIPYDGEDYGERLAAHSVEIGPAGNSRPQVSEAHVFPYLPGKDADLILRYSYEDDDDDLEEDTLVEWSIDGEVSSLYTGNRKIPSQVTRIDQVWCATVTPHDGEDFGDAISSNCVTIAEETTSQPAEISGLHVSPSTPGSKDDLIARYKYFDPDGEPESNTKITWLLNGKPFDNSNFEDVTVIPSAFTAPGQLWQVTVEPRDGTTQSSRAVPSNQVVINTPPEVKNAQLERSGSPLENKIELTYQYSDQDGHVEGLPNIEWYKNGALQPQLNHQTVVSSAELDETWFAVISVFDDHEYSEPYTTTAITLSRLFLPLLLRPVDPIVIETPTPTPTPIPTPEPAHCEENNDTQQTACGPLTFSEDYHGYPEDQDDWYYITLEKTTSLEVILRGYENIEDKGQLVIYETIRNRQTGEFSRSYLGHHTEGSTRRVPNKNVPNALTDLMPGDYLIRVYTTEGHNRQNEYRLRVDQR